jgi:2-keto-4-pentenoate hydratase/2-oxohepta-3-ene-1,7-dioic acid hydratase in catechol pathway
MKFVSFIATAPEPRVGVVDLADNIVDCAAVDPLFPPTMLDFIKAGESGLARARSILATAPPVTRLRREQVELLAPIPRPAKNIFCVGRNYKEHVEEGYRARGAVVDYPQAPQFFTKAPTAVIGPDQDTEFDAAVTQKFDYEAELGIVIGEGGKNISEVDAPQAIFGYTIVNDFTARDLQRRHDQWFKGKSLDRSCAIGPWIVHASAIPDPQDLAIALHVNGEQRQSSRTSRMIFSIARIIHELSLGMTLEPGDIIATGTPQGVGYAMEPPCFLQDGDEVAIDIENIGRLVNHVRQVTLGSI